MCLMKLGLKIAQSKGKKDMRGDNGGSQWYRWLRRSRLFAFLPFLALAFVIWIQQTLQYDVIRPIYIPIGTDSLSTSHGTNNKIPEYLEVQVQDKGIEHIRYSFNTPDTIQLRLFDEDNGSRYMGILRRELGEAISARLSGSAKVVQTSFSELKIPLYKRVGKKLPIKLEGKPLSASGYTISQIKFSPDSLMVYGDAGTIQHIQSISTSPWGDSIISKNIDRMVDLKLGGQLYSDVKQVRLQIKIEELTEQSYTLPIEVVNVPEGYSITTLPATATMLITMPRSHFNDIDPDALHLVVDYSKRTPNGELYVQLIDAPKWFVNVRISPELVQFTKKSNL